MVKVEIYTTPTCAYCKMAKEFFKGNNVEYTEYDVSRDQVKAQELQQKTGMLAVPVIIVGGKDIVIGFDKKKLQELLEIK
ncbi:MAG: thioredoxin family protein [Candidatus Yanofskybacteria bacterium]|nr:thioredoxin family protein [Candidatus Yanofskybacteria bacterium]